MKSTILALLCAAVTPVCASQFNATYLLEDGSSVIAEFDGSLNGITITDISNVSLFIQNTIMPDGYLSPTNIQSYADNGWGIQSGGAVLTLDGSYMNFCFEASNPGDWPEEQEEYGGLFAIYSDASWAALYFYEGGGNDIYDSARWSVNVLDEPAPMGMFAARSFSTFSIESFETKSVPDSSSTLFCLTPLISVLLYKRIKHPRSSPC